MAEEQNDPQWITTPITGDATLVVAGDEHTIRVGVGAFNCTCCGDPNVLLAIVAAGYSFNVRMEPAQALEIAANIMAGLNRVGVNKSGAH